MELLTNTEKKEKESESESQEETEEKEKDKKKVEVKVESDSDDESQGTSTECPHLPTAIKYLAIKKKILNPSKWSCVECATTGNVWACLTCGYIACGRYLSAHAEKHYRDTNVSGTF
jgi:uncharacterized UBP type Zn finger protein